MSHAQEALDGITKTCATCTTPRHEPSDCGNCHVCFDFSNWAPMEGDDFMRKTVDAPVIYAPRPPKVAEKDATPVSKKSDGGPSSYYDFDPGWVTFNDFMEAKALAQWGPFSLHLKDIGKAICRWGTKEGTTDAYDARKIIYSGLRLLIMLEGREAVVALLQRLSNDPQFKER